MVKKFDGALTLEKKDTFLLAHTMMNPQSEIPSQAQPLALVLALVQALVQVPAQAQPHVLNLAQAQSVLNLAQATIEAQGTIEAHATQATIEAQGTIEAHATQATIEAQGTIEAHATQATIESHGAPSIVQVHTQTSRIQSDAPKKPNEPAKSTKSKPKPKPKNLDWLKHANTHITINGVLRGSWDNKTKHLCIIDKDRIIKTFDTAGAALRYVRDILEDTTITESQIKHGSKYVYIADNVTNDTRQSLDKLYNQHNPTQNA
jgi:hypothetical protein